MGSCTHIVDDRKILNQYEYDAWGNVVNQKETVKNRFKFNGQQLDPITQQYYLRARFYNPVIARFTQEDTYRGDGLNLYSYCANNPVYYVDPSGNACKSAKEVVENSIESNKINKLFLPDDFYYKYKLPKQVDPGILYLPKYDEFGNLKQIKIYDEYGREKSWVDYTDHDFSNNHSVPHWHEVIYSRQNIHGMKINHRTDTNTPLGNIK